MSLYLERQSYSDYSKPSELFTLVTGSHFFKVLRPTSQIQTILRELTHGYTKYDRVWERGHYVVKKDKEYGFHTFDHAEYRYHISQLKTFLELLDKNKIKDFQYKVYHLDIPAPAKMLAKPRTDKTLRENQIGAYNYLMTKYDKNSLDPVESCNNRLLPLTMGSGKTFISTKVCCDIGERTAIVIQAKYIDKWIGDILELTDVDPSRMAIISGQKDHLSIRDAIYLAQNKQLDVDFLVISVTSIRNFITDYEKTPYDLQASGCDCHPEALFQELGVGTVVMDEAHLDFYSNYKVQTYSNVNRYIILSGTLISEDSFKEKMHKTLYPVKSRFEPPPSDKYIAAYPVSFQFENINRIRTTEFNSKMYSHNALEKSIMRQPRVLANYLELIKFLVQFGYVSSYQEKDKLIIFASTVQMCTYITDYLRKHFPQFSIERYAPTAGDPYVNIIEPDIRVTTIISGGTAIDIPNLRTAIMTVNILSIQSNLQSTGRLRKLKDRDVKFFYIFSRQIQKHSEYHEKRKINLAQMCSTVSDMVYFKQV